MRAGSLPALIGGGLGAPLLGASQLLALAAYMSGSVVLARMLAPAELGTFAVFAFFLTAVTACGDLGMAASLVRQADEPTERAYAVAFTIQQMLFVGLVVAFWTAAPFIAHWYALDARDVWRLRLLTLCLVPLSLQTVPAAQLERGLAFRRLAVVDLVPALVFNGLLLTLVWRGLGTLAFCVASLGRFGAAALAAQVLQPWRPRWQWDRRLAARSLRFGIPYQGVHAVSVIKSSVAPLGLGLALGTAALGAVEWAAMVAAFPTVGLYALQRLYLPVFARLQDDRRALEQALQQMLRLAHTIVAPLAVLLLVLIDPVTQLVFSDRWTSALPVFRVMWLVNLLLPSAAPLLGMLHALGRARLALRITLATAAGLWLLAVPLMWLFGAVGLALAQASVHLLQVALLRWAGPPVRFGVVAAAVPAWTAAAVAGAWVAWDSALPSNPGASDLCLQGLSGLAVYAAAMAVLQVPQRAVARLRRQAAHA